jgi:subtilisin family serine protease
MISKSMRCAVWALVLAPAAMAAAPEPLKTWVYFADKGCVTAGDVDIAIADVAAAYNERAVERRRLRRTAPGLFDARDLPVAGEYVEAVRALGAEPVVVSRWLNALSVHISKAQRDAIATLPFVTRVEPVRRGRRIEPHEIEDAPRGSARAGGVYGLSQDQLTQVNLIALHEQGYTADGVVVGVLDTGFKRTHLAFNQPGHVLGVIAEWDFVAGDPDTGFDPDDPGNQHSHGTWILGVLGAYLPGELVGGAYDASFILAKTEDTAGEYPAEEDLYVAGLEFIEANGGDMATSSLGYIDWYDWFDLDGQTAVTTVAVNIATANGLVCCTASGNGGRDSDLPTLLAPSDAFEVISCGAVHSDGNLADFSAGGPTADGRLKPEVLALGVGASTVDNSTDDGYDAVNGTSLSTPIVASAVACLLQARPTWTVAQIRQNLFETASDFVANGFPDPEFARGYGIVDAHAAARLCIGDADGSGAVDVADFLGMLEAWGSSDPAYDIAPEGGNGLVDIQDFLALLIAWGPCP